MAEERVHESSRTIPFLPQKGQQNAQKGMADWAGAGNDHPSIEWCRACDGDRCCLASPSQGSVDNLAQRGAQMPPMIDWSIIQLSSVESCFAHSFS